MIGTGEDADLRIKSELEPVSFRLDFNEGLVYDLERNQQIPAAEFDLIHLGSLVLEWRRIRALPALRRNMWKSGVAVVSLTLLVVAGILGLPSEPEPIQCTRFEIRIASSRWQPLRALSEQENQFLETIHSARRSFEGSLRRRSWVSARGELNSLRDKLIDQSVRKECGAWNQVYRMESQLLEEWILDLMKNAQYVEAAEQLEKKSHQIHPVLRDSLEESLLSRARHLLKQSWLVENTQPEKSYELRKVVRLICEGLGKDLTCLDS